MKTLWIILASFAVMNVLAIGSTLAWLGATDRLNKDRILQVRQMFQPTIAQDKEKATQEKAAEAERHQKAAEAEKLAVSPTGASEQIDRQRLADEHLSASAIRRAAELESLKTELGKLMTDIERRENKLASERSMYDAERRKRAEIETSAQFKEALATLEGQKPKDAKQMLKAMLEAKPMRDAIGNSGGGSGGEAAMMNGGEQAVIYLAKMEEGKRTKVIAEFAKEDPALAADLLERLRTRGVASAMSKASGGSSGAPGMAATSSPPGVDRRASPNSNASQ